MMLKIQGRTGTRLLLAGLLAAASSATFAQDMGATPGTMAAAQAQTATPPQPAAAAPANAAAGPRTPGVRAPRTPRPRPAAGPDGAPASTGAPVAAVQPEGRLRPRIIVPESQAVNPMGMPGMMPMPMQMVQGPNGVPQAHPNMPQPAQVAAGPRDPFAPAPPPSAQPAQMQVQPPVISPAAKAAAEKARKEGPNAPSINLACTTPDIKAQGVFVGKIQNRYVYKYKSQYCFDIEP